MIEPPKYIIMELEHHKGEKQWNTAISCKRDASSLVYLISTENMKYHNISTDINQLFAVNMLRT